MATVKVGFHIDGVEKFAAEILPALHNMTAA